MEELKTSPLFKTERSNILNEEVRKKAQELAILANCGIALFDGTDQTLILFPDGPIGALTSFSLFNAKTRSGVEISIAKFNEACDSYIESIKKYVSNPEITIMYLN
jgi:hypothetical protein